MNIFFFVILFLLVSLILIRLFFFIGKIYGYMMILFILFVVLPVGYFIKKYYIDVENNMDYMVYYQNDIDVNDIEFELENEV